MATGQASATAGASGVLQGALYGTGKLPKGILRGSQSLPTLPAAAQPKNAPIVREKPPPGVSWQALMKFLYPARLENPDSCGRLEIFGKFGPTDEDGNLRGGVAGAHVHGDIERYTEQEVTNILKGVPRYPDTGRMRFTELQEIVKASQEKRLGEMAKRAMSGKPIAPPKEPTLPKVPFQSEPVYHLHRITRKKKHNTMEEEISTGKRMHSYSCLLASLEDQGLAEQVKMNSRMCRDLGPLDDKWDRYCALRRTGRSSYVQTRNSYRWNPSMDCGLGNKHPGVSSLLVASCGGSSAAAMLGAS